MVAARNCNNVEQYEVIGIYPKKTLIPNRRMVTDVFEGFYLIILLLLGSPEFISITRCGISTIILKKIFMLLLIPRIIHAISNCVSVDMYQSFLPIFKGLQYMRRGSLTSHAWCPISTIIYLSNFVQAVINQSQRRAYVSVLCLRGGLGFVFPGCNTIWSTYSSSLYFPIPNIPRRPV